jgi:hypothetical protein
LMRVVRVFTPLSRIWRKACGWRQDQSNRLWTNNRELGVGWDHTTALRSYQSQQLWNIPTQTRGAWQGEALHPSSGLLSSLKGSLILINSQSELFWSATATRLSQCVWDRD